MSISLKENTRQKQIEKLSFIVREKKGICINENDYQSLTSILSFTCVYGHSWKCQAQGVLKGRWCPVCAGVVKRSLADVIAIVAKNSGKLSSNDYKNNYTKLEVVCKEGHSFTITSSSLFSGHWCTKCAVFGEKFERRLYTIGEVRHICEFRKGKFLGSELDSLPVNTDHYGNYQCFDGHSWKAKYDSIVRGHWCPICRVPNVDALELISIYRADCSRE